MRLQIKAIANFQLIFLIAFVFLNVALVAVATHNTVNGETISATFSQAADGQKYWGVATALVDSGTFSIPQEGNDPLAKAGPLTPLVFSVFIKLSNFSSSAALIVTFQCCLLFVIGLLSRSIANYFGAPPNLVQALVIFNPSLIGLCHVAQSDILFAFLFTSFTWIVICKLFNARLIERKSFFLLGGVLGLMMLTRDVGKVFFIIIIPLIFCFIYIQDRIPRSQWRYLLGNLVVSALIAGIIYSPWVIRNFIVLNQPTAMASEFQLRDSYALLNSQRNTLSPEQLNNAAWGVASRLSPVATGGGCPDSMPFVFCFVSAVFEEDPKVIAKALVSAWSGTLLAGGASTLANYIGIEKPNNEFSYSGYIAIDRYLWFFSTQFESGYRYYFWLVILTSVFSTGLRLTGVIGFLSNLKNSHRTAATIFLFSCIVLFLAMYMFIGVSRFRAPFEPILMIFGATGLVVLKKRIRRFFGSWH